MATETGKPPNENPPAFAETSAEWNDDMKEKHATSRADEELSPEAVKQEKEEKTEKAPEQQPEEKEQKQQKKTSGSRLRKIGSFILSQWLTIGFGIGCLLAHFFPREFAIAFFFFFVLEYFSLLRISTCLSYANVFA